MIEIRNVTKHYEMGGEVVRALDEVNLRIEDGEYLAVTGPSGSGKSTLLYTIGGLLTPTKGELIVAGTDLYRLSPKDRARFRREKVGFIFQTFELIPYLTAMENVMLPLSIAGVPAREQAEHAMTVLNRVGLTNRIGHKPSELSGGEQQRVSIARGIVKQPTLLLADEPTGNLDKKTGGNIMGLLKELNERDGLTIMIVTHDLDIAKQVERIIGMVDGRVVVV